MIKVKRKKILIVFDDMIADTNINRKVQSVIKELLIRCRIMNISLYLSYKLIFLFHKMSE